MILDDGQHRLEHFVRATRIEMGATQVREVVADQQAGDVQLRAGHTIQKTVQYTGVNGFEIYKK